MKEFEDCEGRHCRCTMVTSHWILLILCYDIMFKVNCVSSVPRLEVNRYIQALGDDVAVTASNVMVGDTVELFYRNQEEAITAQVITKPSETLIFNCGYFFKTGTYVFKLKSSEGRNEVKSRPVNARNYPKVILEWTANHEALSNDVKVSIRDRGGTCKSDIARQNKVYLKMTSEGEGVSAHAEEFAVTSPSNGLLPSYYVIPCEKFSTAGKYQMELVMTSRRVGNVTLSNSDSLNVVWSPDYDLRLNRKSFPCSGDGVTVELMMPPCASPADQVRLLAIYDGGRKLVAIRARGDEDHVTFPCSDFHGINATVEGFCFEYVTESGHVTRTICEPVSPTTDFQMSGKWSPWTEWSSCERPCQTINRRKRICDNPKPRGEGDPCLNEAGNDSLEELVYQEVENDAGVCQPYDVDQCPCGCTISIEKEGTLVSTLTDICGDVGTLIWWVKAPAGRALRFQLVDDQLAEDEYLSIHEGAQLWSMSRFSSVTTRGNESVIQIVRSAHKNNLNSCGFILKFETTEALPMTDDITTPADGQANDDIKKWIEKSISQNPVVVAGIGACVVIICIAVLAVVVHRKRAARRKRTIPPGIRTPMNTRLAMPPDGRSCSNADDTESEPMVRHPPLGNSGNIEIIPDTCIQAQSNVGSSTAYYLAQRQLEVMRRLGKNQHEQTYATGCLSEEAIRQQEELLFGDRKSLHKNEDLRVT